METLQLWVSNNPSGVEIYPGYYALAACLVLDMTVEEAVAKIVYGKKVSREFKPRRKPSKRADICRAYQEGVTDYQELAERFHCSKGYVWLSLIEKGVVKQKDFGDKVGDLMENEPHLTTTQVAARLGCGVSTAARLIRQWYKQHNIGYF